MADPPPKTSARGTVARAVHAARAVARLHGIRAGEPHLLADCNNTVVRLGGLPLVAKVCDTTRRLSGSEALATELEVARHLVRAGAPLAAPSSELPQKVHHHEEHALTFWRYHENDREAPAGPLQAGLALKEVHQALDSYRGPIPFFLDRQVQRAAGVLTHPRALSSLPAADRAFLTGEHSRLSSQILRRRLNCRALHGDPHRGNFLVVRGGCLMIDFESICSGPLEWDLSALPGSGAGLFPVDEELLALLRRLRSLCVAVWCHARSAWAPELARVARFHLKLLREGTRDRTHP